MTGRTLTAAMIVFALIVVPLAAYVGGHYGLATLTEDSGSIDGPVVFRYYRQSWQASIFAPAGRVEGWLTGRVVYVNWLDERKPYPR